MELVAETGGERMDSLMLEESTDERLPRFVRLCEQWEELLFLLSEVLDRLPPEELQERCGRDRAVLGLRTTTEARRLDEAVVVVVRKGNERGMPLHDPSLTRGGAKRGSP